MKLFQIPQINFDHPIATLIVELEKLRGSSLDGNTTPDNIFLLIKRFFHALESVASARIEGNNTTIADYITQSSLNGQNLADDDVLEIKNIESLLSEIDDMQGNIEITHHFIRQMHSFIVKNLKREGSKNPGLYRNMPVKIGQSKHVPPTSSEVEFYMNKLIEFANTKYPPQYDLIKIAMIHHAFAWIHPFDNGNGRVVRALTYALMLKYGFKIDIVGRVVNPVAIFCADRDKYYDMLEEADSLSHDGILNWCMYVLGAVKSEYDKTLKLTNDQFVASNLIKPSIIQLHSLGIVSKEDIPIIEKVILLNSFKKSDIMEFCQNDKAATRKITNLREKNLVVQTKPNSKIYQFQLKNPIFLKLIGSNLSKEGFLPKALSEEAFL